MTESGKPDTGGFINDLGLDTAAGDMRHTDFHASNRATEPDYPDRGGHRSLTACDDYLASPVCQFQ
jgi:hypothetical protein